MQIAISILDQSALVPSCFVSEEIGKFQVAARKNALKLCPGSTIGPLCSITDLRVQILIQMGILLKPFALMKFIHGTTIFMTESHVKALQQSAWW